MGHSERSILVSNPVQGWYADPAGTDQLRWWDGTQWTDRYRALPGTDAPTDSNTSTTPDAGANSPTEPSQTPAGATTEFTPVTQAPAARATRGQVITAVIASIVTLAFLGSTIVAAGMHGKAQDDVHRSQTILNEAKEQLQKVQEAIQ
jgi:putative membrane protein